MASRRTALYADHEDAGARFTDFGGWEMPVSFDSISVEHEAVRTAVGKFDVSHMGNIEVTGDDATTLMQRLVTNDVEALTPGKAQYAAITDEAGIMLDDTIVYQLEAGRYLFIPNAGHNEEMADRWEAYRDENDLDATVTDRTEELGMIAIQGPEAIDLIESQIADSIESLPRFGHRQATIAGVEVTIARTGYTGEDGVELLVPIDEAPAVWDAFACQPCGLGARDTLRLEAGLLLGGNEFDPVENPRTPLEAGIAFAVSLDTEFIGRDALVAQRDSGLDQQLIGFGLEERGIPRGGYAILDGEDRSIGEVTSGTQSPTLDRPIGLGYVDSDFTDPGTELLVDVRGQEKRGKVESLPFVG